MLVYSSVSNTKKEKYGEWSPYWKIGNFPNSLFYIVKNCLKYDNSSSIIDCIIKCIHIYLEARINALSKV